MFCVAQKPQDKQCRKKDKYETEKVGGDTKDEKRWWKNTAIYEEKKNLKTLGRCDVIQQ